MRVSCPACNAEMSLELLLQREADARAVLSLLEKSVPFGALVLSYIALFRPGKRRLGLARMCALVEELLPDIERRAIARKGRDWAAPPELWRAGLQTVLGMRDKGTLTLPLTSHGLLYEVMSSQADKVEGQAEAVREQERRTHRPAGAVQPQAATVAAVVASAVQRVPAAAEPAAVPSEVLQRLQASRNALLQPKPAPGRRRAAAAPADDAESLPPDEEPQP
jgi:hypothetical protein